jgi:hypothetical protein
VKKNGLKSKPFCFIHDSIEVDIHPAECFMMLDAMGPLFNEFPVREFGIPVEADLVIGKSMGNEVKVLDLQVHQPDYSEVSLVLEGFDNEVDDIIDTWKTVYPLVHRDKTFQEKEKEEFVPRSGLFKKKVVISRRMGTSRKKVTRKYDIITK